MDILSFWELTPFEFKLIVKAYKTKTQRQEEKEITLAYMTAYWVAQWFSKQKPPSLKKILAQGQKESSNTKRMMTGEEMFETVKKLHKALGGE